MGGARDSPDGGGTFVIGAVERNWTSCGGEGDGERPRNRWADLCHCRCEPIPLVYV